MALNLSNTVKKSEAFAPEGETLRGYHVVKLTPPLTLTIALMFIIASDGQVDATESSHIQSVIGQNEDIVRFASEYVRAVPLKDFLTSAPQGLSGRDKICILSNVCDAMLADGHVHDIEQKTLQLLLKAFGVSDKEFAPYLQTMRLKNDRSVLGAYRPSQTASSMTPHLALATCVLYMMSADGSIDKHEIGRLETLVAEFDGLQKQALQYVKQTKRERFIQESTYALTEAQKLFILLNVYDTMTADGVIAVTEEKIFASLLSAYEVSSSDFAQHTQVLESKNLKPFDVRKVSVAHLYEMVKDYNESLQYIVADDVTETIGDVVSRTMQSNIATVKQDIGASSNIVQIQGNAMDALNVQKLDAANDAEHRELLDVEASETNRQKLQEDDGAMHRELLAGDAPIANRQKVPVEFRIDHLSDDIFALHQQLTEFENTHKTWLNIGKIFSQQEAQNQQKLLSDEPLTHREMLDVQVDATHRERIPPASGRSVAALAYAVEASDDPVAHHDGSWVTQSDALDEAVTTDEGDTQVDVAKPFMPPFGRGVFTHTGRVLDLSSFAAGSWYVRETLLAVALTVCVSNLGATYSEQHKEMRGPLQRIQRANDLQDASAILQVGP